MNPIGALRNAAFREDFFFSVVATIASFILAQLSAPSVDSFTSGGFSQVQREGAVSNFFMYMVFLFIIIGFISVVAYGAQKFRSNNPSVVNNNYAPVHQGDQNISGHAKVAGPGATLTDYSTSSHVTTTTQMKVQQDLHTVYSKIAASGANQVDVNKAIALITKASKDVSARGSSKATTFQIISQLYRKLEELQIPANLYKVLAKWITSQTSAGKSESHTGT